MYLIRDLHPEYKKEHLELNNKKTNNFIKSEQRFSVPKVLVPGAAQIMIIQLQTVSAIIKQQFPGSTAKFPIHFHRFSMDSLKIKAVDITVSHSGNILLGFSLVLRGFWSREEIF